MHRARHIAAGWLAFCLLLAWPCRAADDAPPELRGILRVSGRAVFCIRHPTREQNVWVLLGQSISGIKVVAHDARRETVTVEFQGRTLVLALPAGKIQPEVAETASDGTNLIPPSSIRDAIRNRALSAEEIKPWADTPWYRDFIKQNPGAVPPVIK